MDVMMIKSCSQSQDRGHVWMVQTYTDHGQPPVVTLVPSDIPAGQNAAQPFGYSTGTSGSCGDHAGRWVVVGVREKESKGRTVKLR